MPPVPEISEARGEVGIVEIEHEADPDQAPDIWDLAERIPEALEELVAAADDVSHEPVRPPVAEAAGDAA